MRKFFLLAAVVAALAVPGTLVAAAPTLSLQASPTTVTYGGTVTLSGTLSSAKTGQAITVEGQDCGKTAFAKVATVMTTTNGAYTASAKPTLNTTYRAKNKGTTSPSVLVKVRPQLKLTRVAAGKFTAKVGAAQSFVGKYVAFQRWSATKRKYATVKKVTLTKVNVGAGGAQVSYATFRVKIKRHLKVRISMPQSQVGTCYAPSNSGSIRS